jgi:hypothetical protein
MAGLVPAIHAFLVAKKGVDARHKAGHDELRILLWSRLVSHTRPATGGFISFSDSVTLCTAFVSIGTMSSTRSVTR